jgi:hypothetical protein
VATVVVSVPAAVIEQKAPVAHGGLDELDRRRKAIEGDGGNSVFKRQEGPAVPATDRVESATDRVKTAADRVKDVTLGLAGVFVPMFVLDALSIVDIQIRSSARLIAAADTLMVDATAALALWLLFVNRDRVNRDALIFAAALAVLVALPLAYVVTNYGMLVRLRLMVAAPIWLLTLALAPGSGTERASPQPDPAVTPV